MRAIVRHVLRHAFKYAVPMLAVAALTVLMHGARVYGAVDPGPPPAPPLAPWMTQEWLIAFTGAVGAVGGTVVGVAKLVQCMPSAVNGVASSVVWFLKRCVAIFRGQPDPGPLPEPQPEPAPPPPPAA